VTAHSDFHGENVLWDKNDQNWKCIDFEFTCVQWAILDVAYLFLIEQFGTGKGNYKNKYDFCKTYLEESGFPTNQVDVDAFIFDAECAKIRVFWLAVLNSEIDKAIKDSTY
jgi:Ser/Thr protein kinase RdoA (MazF antagonist)